MKGIPAQNEISDILFNDEKCRKWLIDTGIILKVRKCETCNKDMILNRERMTYRHYCNIIRTEISVWKNTLFSRTHLKCNQIMNLLYLWIVESNHKTLMATGKHSSRTITQFIRDINDMVSNMVEEEDQIIGGPGIVVEIDESKLSKRKYHRGHRVEGVWVVGGVEKTNERKIFIIPVENRNSETLSNIIEKHVAYGSIIHTDCWKGYNFLDQNTQYEHYTVNHSKHFKDPRTKVHTNTIEGTWAAVKLKIAKRYRCENGIQDHLFTFLWRRKNNSRLWDALIEALIDYHWIE
jgi:transposase-like protein